MRYYMCVFRDGCTFYIGMVKSTDKDTCKEIFDGMVKVRNGTLSGWFLITEIVEPEFRRDIFADNGYFWIM